MLKFMENSKGAISIFLVIVLVPMLTVASVMVDMSRIRLANAVATSAGDLTLNTALTNYDAVLKEMYGLFASSQDTDEMFEKLEEYYTKCIESAGVPDVDAENYVDQIMSLIKSETGTDDLMNMNLTSFQVSTPEGSNLANPAVLKSQIVEFMKYRAPINLGTGMFEALASMKNLKKQTELVENKNNFYTEQASMMERLEKIYNYLDDYQNRYANAQYNGDVSVFPTGDMLDDIITTLDQDADTLEGAISKTVRYVYFANNINASKYSITYSKGDDADSVFDDKWTVKIDNSVNKEFIPDDKNDEDKAPTSDDVLEAFQVAFAAIQAVEKYTDPNTDAGKLYNSIMGAQNVSVSRKIQLVSEYNSKLGSGYQAAVINTVQAIVTLQGLYESYIGNDSNEVGLDEIHIHKNDDNSWELSQKTSDPTLKKLCEDQIGHLKNHMNEQAVSNDYICLFNEINKRVKEYSDAVKETVTQAKKNVSRSVSSAYTEIYYFNDFLTGRIDLLSKAITELGNIKTDLQSATSEYNKALTAWKNSANGLSDDSMGQADASEIAKLEKVLTVTKVEKLVTRLTAAKTTLEGIKSKLDGYKILGQKWIDFGYKETYSLVTLVKNSYDSQIKSVTPTKNATSETFYGDKKITTSYDSAYNSIITTVQGTVTTPTINLTWEDKDSPDLQKQQVELYTYLYNNFNTNRSYGQQVYGEDEAEVTESKEVANNKNKADNPQSSLDNAFTKDDNGDPPSGTQAKRELKEDQLKLLPSGEWKAAEKEIREALKANSDTDNSSDDQLAGANEGLGFLDKVLEAAGNMASDFRDNMYVANYIMNMFSYSTYEAELTMKYGGEEEKGAFESWYTETKDENTGEYSYALKDKFNIAALQDEAKTLTRVSINPNANYLYGQEVEYIIYGSTNSTAASYGTIYLIRFALNTVYAFMDAEINNITMAAATALFGVPPLTALVPVAKIAFTIGLALAESAWDLYELKSGEEVPLMKNKDTWMMKPSSAAKALVGEVVDTATTVAFEKGEKIFDDLLEMTDEELTALINDGTNDFDIFIGDIVESTMGELNNYANAAVQELVSICNNVNQLATESENYVKGKSDEKIEQASQALDAWLETQNTGDIIYEAKKIAVKYIKDNKDEIIGKLFDTIANIGIKEGETVESTIKSILKDITGRIESHINTLSGQAGNALHDLKNKALDSIKEAAKEGAESLRSTVKEKIGATFGTGSAKNKGTTSVVNSLLSWAYSDYLELFLVVGIIASPEGILLRTADVIQLNMQTISGNYGWMEKTEEKEVSRLWGLIKYTKKETVTVANPEAYRLSQSFTHLKINATIEVKPLLMTLPLMADTVESQLTGTNWYQIEYEGILGY